MNSPNPQMMTVRMPDGQLVKNIPVGTPKDAILARYNASKAPIAEQPVGKVAGDLAGNAVSGSTIAAIPEVMATGITGLASTAAGTIAGLGQYLGTGGREGGLEAMHEVQAAGTYQPRSEQGQRAMALLEKGIGEMRRRGQIVGDMVYDATDSPLLAAAANTLTGGSVDILLAGLGLRTGAKAAVRAKTKANVEADLAAKAAEEAKVTALQDEIKAKSVDYEPTPVQAPRPGSEPVTTPGSGVPPVVENPAPQTVAPKAAPDLLLEEAAAKAKPRANFDDPLFMEEMAAKNVKEATTEAMWREQTLKQLREKYPHRSSKASPNTGKFGQGGAVDFGAILDFANSLKLKDTTKEWLASTIGLAKKYPDVKDTFESSVRAKLARDAGDADRLISEAVKYRLQDHSSLSTLMKQRADEARADHAALAQVLEKYKVESIKDRVATDAARSKAEYKRKVIRALGNKQGGMVNPSVFAEGVKAIFDRVGGNKNKFRSGLIAEFGGGMDDYHAALYKQLTGGADAILVDSKVPALAQSASIAKGKATLAALAKGENPERPGGYSRETVGAVEETAAIAEQLIQAKKVIPWAETEAAAKDLGLSMSQINRVRTSTNQLHAKVVAAGDYAKAQLDSIKEVAARAAKTGSDEDLYVLGQQMLELGSVVDDAAGIASNAARALNATKILKEQGRVADSIMNVLDTFKGTGNLRAMAEAISKLEGSDIVRMARVRPTKWGAASEVYVNMLLTSTLTHARNLSGNTVFLAYSIPQNYLVASLGKLPFYKGTNPISFREANAYASAGAMALKDAVVAAGKTLRTNEPQIKAFGKTMSDEASKIETYAHRQFTSELLPNRLQGTALGKAFDMVGEGVRLPGRVLLAEDAFFKSLAYSMEASRLAVREARKAVSEGKITKDQVADFITDYKSRPIKEAMDWAHKMTFTRELGELGKKMQNFANHHPAARFVAPFIRTPINLQKEALSGTPAALLHPQIRASIKAGGVEGTRALSHVMMGSALMYTIYELAKDGKFIGSAPGNPDARKVFNDKFNGAENAVITEDGKAVSVNGLGVFDTVTGLAADAVQMFDYMDDGQWEQVSKLLTATLTNNLLDKTFSQGVFDIVTAMTNSEQYGYRVMDYTNTLTTPRIVAQAARNADPVIRTPRGYAPEDIDSNGQANLDAARRILDQVKRDVPWQREDLPMDYDLVGRPKMSHASWVNPFVTADAQDNKVINELFELKHTVQVPRANMLNVDLDKYQHAEYKRLTGVAFDRLAQRHVGSSSWDTKPGGIKKVYLTKLHEAAKKQAQAQMLKEYPVLLLRIPASHRKEANDLRSYEVPKYFK